MIIHDFTMICHIRVLHVHAKINHLRTKINEIKDHHHVPYGKSSEIDPLLDQNNPVSMILKNQLGLCSWRVFLVWKIQILVLKYIKLNAYVLQATSVAQLASVLAGES